MGTIMTIDRWGQRTTGKLSNFPKVVQLVIGRAGIWTAWLRLPASPLHRELKKHARLCFYLSRTIGSRHSEKRAKSHDTSTLSMQNNHSFLKYTTWRPRALALYKREKSIPSTSTVACFQSSGKRSAADHGKVYLPLAFSGPFGRPPSSEHSNSSPRGRSSLSHPLSLFLPTSHLMGSNHSSDPRRNSQKEK